MNNHASIHRNAKVYIKAQTCDPQYLYTHYQGIIVSADNIGVTLDGYSVAPFKDIYESVNAVGGKVFGKENAEAWVDHIKETQKYGTFFLPWSNIAELEVK